MRLIYSLVFSVVILVVLIGRTETILYWRHKIHGEQSKDNRKKNYQEDLIFWAVCTIGIIIFFVFFAKV